MKSMNGDNNNWLGFSLSPQNTIVEAAHTKQDSSVPTSFFHSPVSQINYNGFNYVAENENDGLMPVSSDGSLCLMEAITRSQSQAPKLEDFFGGVTMSIRQYENKEALYHNQNSSQQQDLRQSEAPQFCPFYSAFETNETHQTPLQEQNKETQVGDEGIKKWVSSSFSNDSKLDMEMVDFNSSNNGGLSLSMSSVCSNNLQEVSASVLSECVAIEVRKRGSDHFDQKQIANRKSLDTHGQRTSQYRGVTRHRWTGRYEAHLWDNSCKKEGQSRKGRQVYLGGYDTEEKAARAYDQAALKYWGPSTHINFPLESYEQVLQGMKNMSRQEYIAHLRRKSSGFSRGASMYRGVTRHHQHGRWQARIGRVAGNKDLYLGTFSTQEEAAEAYDIAAVKFRGVSAVTNFDITKYDVERIMESRTLLSGELARRSKETILSTTSMTLKHNHSIPHLSKRVHVHGHNTTDHLSNTSSLVTSLNNSREVSPDKNTTMSSWTSSNPQNRPTVILPHVPVFAAWTDT